MEDHLYDTITASEPPMGFVLGLQPTWAYLLLARSALKTMCFQSLSMLLVGIPHRTVSLLDLPNSNRLFKHYLEG